MLSGVCIGTNDIAAAGAFYDAVLGTLGMTRAFSDTHELGFAQAGGDITVFVISPFNEQPATHGNGTQFMFYAPDHAAVRAFHETALAQGGTDEGAPGPRAYHPDYYGAYARDLDGNKLNVSVRIAR